MNTPQEEEENQNNNPNNALIETFIEITSSSSIEAQFYLESHNYDLDAAVSTFLDSSATAAPRADVPVPTRHLSPSQSPPRSASPSPSRSRSPSPPSPPSRASQYSLRSKSEKKASGSRAGKIRTFSDLNQTAGDGSDSDSDGPQEYYTGGEKSGMLVQDPSRKNDVDAIFNQAWQSAVEAPADQLPPSSSSRGFTGTARLLSGETVSSAAPPPQQPEVVTHSIVFWTNGFTIDDGPLRRFDDPANASFLESIKKSECPKELEPADRKIAVHVNLSRREEKCPEPEKRHVPFHGVGRTLGSTASPSAVEPPTATTSLITAPAPSMGLIVDQSLPSTSIQLRLADGTRMVSRFNYNHTINDIRSFIDASRPGGSATYQLQTVGFPPKQLTDLNQTIEQAGLASSVIIQKF